MDAHFAGGVRKGQIQCQHRRLHDLRSSQQVGIEAFRFRSAAIARQAALAAVTTARLVQRHSGRAESALPISHQTDAGAINVSLVVPACGPYIAPAPNRRPWVSSANLSVMPPT